MDTIELLRKNVTQGSASYGYTLCIWGSGALLFTRFDLIPKFIFSYISGALVGFALLAFMAFKDLFTRIEPREEILIVVSMVHFIGALGTIYVSYLLISIFTGNIHPWGVFFLVGINATFTFNLLLLVEHYFSEFMLYLESRLAKML